MPRRFHAAWASPVIGCAFALALPLAAEATAGRTFVKSTGNDANTASNCPVTAPCQTFAVAYSVTNVGGEIVVIDGAGYGPLTITGPITVIAEEKAFIKPPPGSAGITITGGGRVTIQNIEINGSGGASTTGIALDKGFLVLKNSVLTQLSTGLAVADAPGIDNQADLIDCDIINNTLGVSTDGIGPNNLGGITVIYNDIGSTEVRLRGGNVIGNTTAFNMFNPGASFLNPFDVTNNITILVWNNSITASTKTGTTPTGRVTYIAGNGTLMTGSGDSCGNNSCKSFIEFTGSPSVNLQ
jgi:hypothetical protein